ncbi:MAG: ATP synthase F1 subunit epsilon [Clostridia bacterium]|nr:ATP synthase F1 subunit epsilon [Clostridia bacterium]
MSSTFYLEILSHNRVFYTGNAENLILPVLDGEMGVLAKHEPMVSAICAGEMRFKVNGEWKIAAVGDGFAEIMPEYVVILVDTVELPEEIDVRRAQEAKQRAEEKLKQKENLIEYYHARAALARAMARLKVTGKHI